MLRAEVDRIIRDVIPSGAIPATETYFDVKGDPSSLKQIQMLHTHSTFIQTLAGYASFATNISPFFYSAASGLLH